jgi:hypothetical protein
VVTTVRHELSFPRPIWQTIRDATTGLESIKEGSDASVDMPDTPTNSYINYTNDTRGKEYVCGTDYLPNAPILYSKA